MKQGLVIEDWGLVEYSQALERQRALVQKVLEGAPDHLVLCEHPAVLTLGRMTKPENLLYQRHDIEARGVALAKVDRGGDVTLHAPGQLVVYPIFNLNNTARDLKVYMESLQEVAVDLLKNFGILAISVPGQRGVFVGPTKIISIGVGLRKWVTYHGLAINVNTDLSLFDLIKPCGLNVRMTSMQELKGHHVPMQDVKPRLVEQFQRRFCFL
ncbi:MAG: lipoyl(octanoyl) transferase LipB [Candidatus Omnitrophica bacterium]|nr:lipoyl(octanoyl) transferase LipB [Candidatus Omnitrophota bacterium]MDE2010000.1 lipoyl(octanoyl) transferase LipB [Candidatus Omnitrophota bacterium]MDE2215032.1 lipoyl(octanoyl) transferase LipB [Candidatus Omnitrophota bacterium]MDE2231732.1 lipoyl(octanoyl) transferase LipB [Candidatus Omnitrophota bacterium]